MKAQKNILIVSIILLVIIASTSCEKKDDEGDITSTGWFVSNSENFEYNMTYITKIAFKNTISINPEVEVAAFCNDECRGFAKLTLDENSGDYMCLMSIFSNSASGETISIKVYNPEKKKIYDPNKTLAFRSNSSEGDVKEILNCE
ncbi:hypothetical protein LJC11_02065 [Bacteroidales bacterium OttesenSCG-928-I21]|nr:hypothetical protein [Bacteroidales bacterium OttesenSCG-928-I21]